MANQPLNTLGQNIHSIVSDYLTGGSTECIECCDRIVQFIQDSQIVQIVGDDVLVQTIKDNYPSKNAVIMRISKDPLLDPDTLVMKEATVANVAEIDAEIAKEEKEARIAALIAEAEGV